MDKESSQVLNEQKLHWERTYSKEPQMFGEEPSQPARNAADLFRKEGKTNILELGGGQGRDTIFFAKNSFKVTAGCVMALTTAELEFLSGEVRRALKPAGLCVYTVRHTGDSHYRKGIHRGEDMYEVGGFIVHFFSRQKVERLAKGYEIVSIDEFEEGELPRKLFLVTVRKKE